MTITVSLELGKRKTVYFQKLDRTINRTVLQFGRELTAKALELNQIGLMTENVCKLAATAACETSYRAAAKTITETTGLSISP